MTLTTIDAKPALVVIDLQKEILALSTVHPVDEIVRRAAELARAFRRHGLPVVLVTAAGRSPGRTEARSGGAAATLPPNWADLLAELSAGSDDYRVAKKHWGAFYETSLHSFLQESGVTQVVLAGIATSIGVETTARAAYEHGYNVVLATDAMTDTNADAHHNSITRIFPALGETATVGAIIEMLERRMP